MPRLTTDKLAKLIKSGEVAGETQHKNFLLYGDEPRRVADAARALKESVLPQIGGGDSFFRYMTIGAGPDDPGVGDLISQLNTVSMFGSGKLVWLGPLGAINKELGQALCAYAKNPNPKAILVITVSFPKGSRAALQKLEKSAFFSDMTKHGVVTRFSAPGKARMPDWVKSRFAKYEVTISKSASALLAELCDNDLDKLDGEIAKLSAYIGYTGEVTVKDIESTVGDCRTDKIWDLTRAFGRMDLDESRKIMSNLLENSIPAQVILKTLSTEAGRIATARASRAEGLTFRDYAKEMGDSEFALKNAWSASEKWSRIQAIASLKNIMDAYMNIMRANAGPETSLELLLVKTLTHEHAQKPAMSS